MVFLHRRVLLLAIAGALLAATGSGLSGCGSGARKPLSAALATTPITVQAYGSVGRVPFGFLGLSLEYPAVEEYAGSDPRAVDPVFEQLVRNLDPGQAPVLRIGGDTADRAWWPTAGIVKPPGITYSITPRWLAVTRALADALRARLILGLNLEADSQPLAASEANALLAGIGSDRVRAFELGNEPDLYATFPWYRTSSGQHVTGRPANYDMSSLIDDFTRFAAVLPAHRVLAGPSLGAPGWTRQLGRFLAAVPRVGLVTLHRYPLQLCYVPRGSPRYPTIAHLLESSSSIGLADSFAPYAAVARARGLSLRIDELNSVSCGADRAVSQTFASALWVLGTLFEMARDGIHGVDVHTFPGAGYELFRLARAGGRWRARVSPEYYGLLLFARAAPPGARLLAVSGASSGKVRTWATRASDGTIRVLMVNEGTAARRLAVGVAGAAPERAALERLSAPSVHARSGVTLAGQSFASQTATGELPGTPAMVSVPRAGGRYQVTLPGDAAAMLILAPAS